MTALWRIGTAARHRYGEQQTLINAEKQRCRKNQVERDAVESSAMDATAFHPVTVS